MKKLWSILVCILLLSAIAITAFAASNDTLVIVSANKTEVKPGDTVQVTLSVSGTDPFTSMGYLPVRNSPYFTVDKYTYGEALEANCKVGMKFFSAHDGFAAGAFTDPETDEDIAVVFNGTILTFWIKIKEDAPAGQFTITELVSFKNHINSLSYTLEESEITVTAGCEHTYQAQNVGNSSTHALVCTKCGNTLTESHTWDAGVITKEPTYTQEGEKTFTCAPCGATKTQSVPKLENIESNGTKVTVSVDKTVVVPGDTVKVTVSVTGNDPFTSMGYLPNRNSEYFTIAESGSALRQCMNLTVLRAPGIPAICTFSQSTGLAVAGYTDDTDADIAVTLNGVILNFTIQIKEDAPAGQFTITELASFKNHINSLSYTLEESEITVTTGCEHTYQAQNVGNSSIHALVCAKCGNTLTESHTWDAGVITKEPTYTQQGIRTFTCKLCSATKTQTIPKLEISNSNDTKVTVSVDKTIVAPGDIVNVTVSVTGTDPFTSMGYCHDTASKYFTIVNAGLSCINTKVIEAPGKPCILSFNKNMGMAVAGYVDDTDADIAVTLNGVILNFQIKIKENSPVGEFKITRASSGVAFKNGSTQLQVELIEPTITVSLCDHTYGAATNINAANHQQLCTLCGVAQISAHTWDSGKITTEPNCVTNGVRTFSCTACSATKTEAVAATGIHNYINATPVDADYHSLTCSDCGDAMTVAHNWDAGTVTRQPDCGNEGERVYICPDCSAVQVTVIPVTGEHTWDTGVVTLEPTCTLTGIKTYTCTTCAATYTETIPATGLHNFERIEQFDGNNHKLFCICGSAISLPHTWDAGQVTTAPTCKDTGVKTFTCTACEQTKTESLEKTEDHKFGAWTHSDSDTHVRFCDVCAMMESAAHVWDEGRVTTEPTCKDTGIKTFSCECGSSKTLVLPVSDVHSFGDWTAVDGNTHSRNCPVCDAAETEDHNIVQGVCTVCSWKVPYVITFLDENGAELSKATYHYGDTVTVPAEPTKAADKTYTYTFAGWNQEVTAVEGDATYTATYTSAYIEYTVKFVYDDGTVIHEAAYHYGDQVNVPADPEKAPTAEGKYTFIGWDKEISTVTEDATYTAQFTFEITLPDFNQDGRVTDADAIYLLRHTLFPEDFPLVGNGDINCDGKTTDADAIYLLRHTLFPADFPLYPKKEQ